jgi:hypothetical protein
MSITVNMRRIADVRMQAVVLASLVGGHELRFHLYVQVLAGQTGSAAIVWGAEIKVRGEGRASETLGFARFPAPLRIVQAKTETSTTPTLSLPLTPHQISAVEELRAGGGLTFELVIVGEGGEGSGSGHTHQLNETWQANVAQSSWLEQLRSAKVVDTLLLEVAMPVCNVPEDLRQVQADLREAQLHFQSGQYSACVVCCRRVIQELGHRQSGDGSWHSEPLKLLGSGARGMSKGQRELAVGAAVRHLANLAPHPEGEGGVAFDRSEAKFVLSLTAAIAARWFEG